MFYPFRRKKIEGQQIADEGVNLPTIQPEPKKIAPKPAEETPKKDPCYYTVGRTNGGQTVLRLNDENGYSSMSLTMNPSAVRQMIRMLEATLVEEETKEIENAE